MNTKIVRLCLVAGMLCVSGAGFDIASAQQAKKGFTVADDIVLTDFGDASQAIRFSPDGNYFAVYTEHGRLDLNRPEDSLRFYRSLDIEKFLEHHDESQSPSPIWVINLSTDKKGPIIKNWTWLANARSVAFLEPTANGNQRLVLADLSKKTIKSLSSAVETVGSFDVRDPHHYVYTLPDPAEREKEKAERQAPSIVGTGHSLFQLLIPDDPAVARLFSVRRYHLWAVDGDKRFEVKHNGTPIIPGGQWIFSAILALSPDGNSVVTTMPVAEVPESWETLFPPPFTSLPHRIRAHEHSVSQYVLIDLQTGSVQALTDAPISNDAGWEAYGSPRWSSDGREILLPNTFLSFKDPVPSRPCVAVVNIRSNTATCVETFKGEIEPGGKGDYHEIYDANFVQGDRRRVVVSFYNHEDRSFGATEYKHAVDGKWQVVGPVKTSQIAHGGLEVVVKQGLNEPPVLLAASGTASRVIWDPNPQLKNIDLGHASVYTWKDKEGRSRKSGLYKPRNYKVGRHYPLVIQPYTFRESEFRPSGAPFTTAFAALALAAEGIVVLQGGQDCPQETPDEGPCTVASYEAATNQLVSDGLVDPDKIGIIGFSRSCFWVMEGLTSGSLHIKAASITDGSMENYLQYITTIDYFGNTFPHLYDSTIGAPPFGEGLRQWLKRSPGFNLDKINAPLLVVAEGPLSLLAMWEPYAGLRYLQKPVDLIMLNTDEHVLTNPAVRMASQGGTVDWFRFWLQDYEDPDPAKVEQYARWRQLRKLQEDNDKSK